MTRHNEQRARVDAFLNGASMKWDGKYRAATWLIRHAGADDNDGVRSISKKWLISAVARALDPGCRVDGVLVLQGAMGCGKSSLLRVLAGDEHYGEPLPLVAGRDTAVLVAESWIVELADLGELTEAESIWLKAFVTVGSDVFRPPYQRNAARVKRACVFAATTNERTHIIDAERRWWRVGIGKVDLASLAAERTHLWAEAVHLYRAGVPWWLDDEPKQAA